MLSRRVVAQVSSLARQHSRSFAASSVACQKASDPIQQLFVDKVREYAQKKTSLGGGQAKLVDASPQVEKDLQNQLEKVAIAYGGSAGEDMTKFPAFKFTEPTVEDIKMN